VGGTAAAPGYDLVLAAPGFAALDAHLGRTAGAAEIREKRFRHRAFEVEGVMVEVLLVERDPGTVHGPL
jgi:hypothetical protein